MLFISQWLPLPLVDNYRRDTYAYQLHVYTGFQSDAFTESNIMFTLVGTNGDTGVRKLKDGIRKVSKMNKKSYNTLTIVMRTQNMHLLQEVPVKVLYKVKYEWKVLIIYIVYIRLCQ